MPALFIVGQAKCTSEGYAATLHVSDAKGEVVVGGLGTWVKSRASVGYPDLWFIHANRKSGSTL